MGNPVLHFEIMGKDAAKLREYYSALFGWTIDASNPMAYGLVTREDNMTPDGNGIGGGIGQLPDGMDSYATFYVGVDDVEAALAEAERLGGTRVMGPEQVMEGVVIGLFQDPEGNLLGVAGDHL